MYQQDKTNESYRRNYILAHKKQLNIELYHLHIKTDDTLGKTVIILNTNNW